MREKPAKSPLATNHPPSRRDGTYLAAIVECSDDAIIGKTVEGVIASWNEAAARIFGYAAEEAVGQPGTIIIPSDRAEEEHSILLRIRSGEHVVNFETVRRRKDGLRIDVSLTISPIRDEGGQIIGVSKIARDITPQKRTKESATRLQLAIDGAPNGIVMITECGVITMVNAQMERLFGYPRYEMIGQPIEMLLPERYRGVHPQQRSSFFRSPEVRAMGHGRDLYARRKDGSEFAVEVGLNPVELPEGKFVLAAVIDITVRKDAEREAAKSTAQLRVVVDAAPNGMVMVNERGIMVLVNAQMERLFGYTRAEMLDQPIEMLLPERYRGAHPGQRHAFFLSPAVRAMGHGRDLFARRKDGSEFPVEVGLNPAKTPEGDFVLAAVIDITQRKHMEQALAQAHADLRAHADLLETAVRERTAKLEDAISDLETFSYTVSHDLRSPLRTMQGFAHLVLADYGDRLDAEARSYLQRIASAAERMDLLIMEVLAFSRVGRAPAENQPIDLEALVDEIIGHHRSFQPPAAEIEIVRPLAPVLGNRITLEQAVLQILLNAAKFVAAGTMPHITIWTEKKDSAVRVSIRDRGIGIPENAQAHVFKPFHRAHPEAGYSGTGMGLAIVKRAIERQGGAVGVQSAPGDGSVFWIELPAAVKLPSGRTT